MEHVLGIGAFELQRVLEMDPEFLDDKEHMHDDKVFSVGAGSGSESRRPKQQPSDRKSACRRRHRGAPWRRPRLRAPEHRLSTVEARRLIRATPARARGRAPLPCLDHLPGFTCEGELDMERTNAWIAKLLQEKGTDIFRMKGVLAMAGCEDKYVNFFTARLCLIPRLAAKSQALLYLQSVCLPP